MLFRRIGDADSLWQTILSSTQGILLGQRWIAEIRRKTGVLAPVGDRVYLEALASSLRLAA